MHSLFIGFKTHAAFSIQKGRLSLIFFKRNFSFPQLFFFLKKQKTLTNSEMHRSWLPASSEGCHVQQTSLILLENNHRAPPPLPRSL